ncbi:DUF659 family protein, partial [Rhizoctonia solani AG-3 Rhs1AP]
MTAKLWHWKYFQTHPHTSKSGKGLRSNQHYQTAWCRACILAYTEVLHQKDLEDMGRGLVSEVRSLDECLSQAFLAIRPVAGRREGFEPHIRSCERIDPAAKARLAQERAHLLLESSPWLSDPNQEGISDITKHLVHPTHNLSKKQQAELEADLCKLFVANGWAWQGVNGPETQIFFQKWFPAATLPDRHKLSGPILQSELEAANASMRDAISGRVATGMSDGWKNIKRNSLIASMLSVDYTTYTVKVHDVSTEHKTADNHLRLVLDDIDYAEKEHNTRVIAWVSDAGGDSRAMRVRLHRLRPYILVFDCWAHQINLVVGDILSRSSRLVDTADSAISIIKWMLRHSYLLGLLYQEQVQGGKKPRSLTLPVLTRWTSHFLSFRSLLTESRSIRSLAARNPEAFRASAGRSPEKKEEVDRILKTIEDPGFWNQLTELKLYLEPLAIAANVSQASSTRLDHILIELGRLYHAFSQLGFNPKIREIVLESLERRWGKADQDPFILAVFLNPFIRGRLFSRENTLLNRSGVYGVVKRVFRRIFRKENDLELYKAFLDYYEFRNEYSPDRWDYREQHAVHEEHQQKRVG